MATRISGMWKGGLARRIAALFAAAALAAASANAGVPVVTRYRSPKNPERRVRPATTLIVLHTTEAPAKGSLHHLSERGECHYCVTEDGTVYQIVDRHRVAFHAGRSMWNGKEDVDDFSVGIECVGYHDKAMPKAQLTAIRDLVKELQKIYSIADHNVVTHGQVAYGDVNKWQKRKHRGRKRCGMLFAMPSVRAALGLKSRAAFDPDVKARRLVVGDDYLSKALYGNVDTMRGAYGKGSVASVDPTARASAASSKPPAPKPPAPPQKPAPKPASKSFRKIPQSVAELRRQGFVSIGSVTKSRLPLNIAGKDWNAPDTYYTLRGRVIPGNVLDPRRVEEGMNVWRKKK